MAGFDRRQQAGIDDKLAYIGRGSIRAALFDLGLYPAAVPAPDREVWGEVYEVTDAEAVLPALDVIEGYTPEQPDSSLYLRSRADVTLPDGRLAQAWSFYNAPLGRAQRIPSVDTSNTSRPADRQALSTPLRAGPAAPSGRALRRCSGRLAVCFS